METGLFKRVIWIVIDGVGAGALPDANKYGDEGSNTLGNTAKDLHEKHNRKLNIPNMQSLGIGNITPLIGIAPTTSGEGIGCYGRAMERSIGKDTSSGHWELAGLVVENAFQTYPNGFSDEIVQRWIRENNLAGVLGNKPASGTEILDELGMEHIKSGKPILYTSADSVWQVAAHEEHFGLEKLYAICKSARKLCDELQISRVIARPFVGQPDKGIPFKRTYNRKDYAQLPFQKTYLSFLEENGSVVTGVGKIASIYAKQGVSETFETAGNANGIQVILEQMTKKNEGLIFCNLIDFDMQYGHRRDASGFGNCLEEFDSGLAHILKNMKQNDLLLICADHGNDPTFKGSDHTREYIPIMAYSPAMKTSGARTIGTRTGFGDIGATALEALLGAKALETANVTGLKGKSFISELLS